VVSGGAGFIGSHLCDRLLERGHEVVALDNLVTGSDGNVAHLRGNPAFRLLRHDVSRPIDIEGPVDYVLHFASPASPIDFPSMPIQIVKVGTLGTYHMLGLALAKEARFLLASTSEVYGDPLVHPQPESYWGNVNPIGPRGCYDEAKRCAEAFTLAYHRAHGVDTRIMRIFNSILADEQVLYDDGHELRREPVEKLARRLGGSGTLGGYRVPAFGRDGTIAAAEADALVGHPTDARCFEVRTRYGRSIRVTGNHSLFVKERGRPVPRPVTDLRVGDHIALAGRIAVPERDRKHVDLIDAWDRAERDPWQLVVRHPALGELVQRRRFELFAAIAARKPGVAPRWRCFAWGEIARHRERCQLPLGAMRALAIPVPEGARVRLLTAGKTAELPRRVELTDDLLWLLGLYVAEGCRYEESDDAFIGLRCDAALLDQATDVLQRTLGLRAVRAAGNASRGPALYVHSRLLLFLLDHLDFRAGPKRLPGWVLGLPLSRLKWVLEGYRAGDGVHSGRKLVEGRRHEFSTVSTDLKDDLVVALARFGLLPSVGRYETTFRQRTGDRRYPFWRLTLCNVDPWSPLDWDRGPVQQRLNARRTGDLIWATVSSIAEVPATPLVYDFCVPGSENFWAGSGVMAHNTYGARMRLDDGRVIPNYFRQALTGRPLTVYGDGSQTRSLCYVDDLVSGALAVLDGPDPMPFNIGSQDEVTMLELARIVRRVTGSRSEVVFEPLPQDDPRQRRPDTTRAREILGWRPTVSLEEGLARTLDYFRTALRLRP
jgi:UDP-glucuronate decarboxylase